MVRQWMLNRGTYDYMRQFKDRCFNLGFRAISAGARLPKSDLISKFISISRLADLLRKLAIDTLLDVGANKGQYASKIRRLGYAGEIISFEPSPGDFSLLERLAAVDGKWRCANVALGSSTAVEAFNVIEAEPGYTVFSSLLAPSSPSQYDRIQKVDVQVKKWDDIISDYAPDGARLFLKMDTQGYDLEVCKGFEGHLGQVLAMQTELSVQPLYEQQPSYLEALEYLQSRGFSLLDLTPVNRDADGLVIEYDALLVNRRAIRVAQTTGRLT